jgi:hypothetical protein
MNPDELDDALTEAGLSPTGSRRHFPELQEGDNAETWDYHLVYRSGGRVAVELPDDRSNKTSVTWWGEGPAVFDTADEARDVIFALLKQAEELRG